MKRFVLILALCIGNYNVLLAYKDHHHDHDSDKKRAHKAHVHGSGKLSLVAMDNQLMIEMEIPGYDIVGFEHNPSTDEQKKSVRSAIEFLQDSRLNIGIAKDARCTPDGAGNVETGLESSNEDHHDEHHVHHSGGSDHAEFHIIYNFSCDDISELAYVEILTFSHFSNMEKLKAQAATESGQFSATITADSTRFNVQ